MENVDGRPIGSDEAAALFAALRGRRGVALAVSGGADSTALLFLYHRARALDPTLPPAVVVSVDHRLRAEAAAEVAAVARRAVSLGLSHRALTWDEAAAGGNLQARAAAARRRLLLAATRERGADTLLLAHHADDQAETVLARLARGSGVVGLAAMAAWRDEGDVAIVRPLLAIPKSRLIATLRAAGWDWIEDPSNRDERFLRARLRAAGPVLEELGLTRERLVETARVMARAAAALETLVDDLAARTVGTHPAGWAWIDRAGFGAAPAEIRLRLLARLARSVAGAEHAPRLDGLEAIEAAALSGAARVVRTLAGVRFEVRGGRIWLAGEGGRTPERLELAPGAQGVWRGRRVRLGGEAPSTVTIAPLGADGRRAMIAAGAGESLAGLSPRPSAAVIESAAAVFVEGRVVACPDLGRLGGDDRFAVEMAGFGLAKVGGGTGDPASR